MLNGAQLKGETDNCTFIKELSSHLPERVRRPLAKPVDGAVGNQRRVLPRAVAEAIAHCKLRIVDR